MHTFVRELKGHVISVYPGYGRTDREHALAWLTWELLGFNSKLSVGRQKWSDQMEQSNSWSLKGIIWTRAEKYNLVHMLASVCYINAASGKGHCLIKYIKLPHFAECDSLHLQWSMVHCKLYVERSKTEAVHACQLLLHTFLLTQWPTDVIPFTCHKADLVIEMSHCNWGWKILETPRGILISYSSGSSK